MTVVAPRWAGQRVALVAPGPSLTRVDCERLLAGVDRAIVLARAWELLPEADLLYHADASFWDRHQGVPAFAGEKWTQDRAGGLEAAARWGLQCVPTVDAPGLSEDPARLHAGHHGGFQGLNLATLAGATRVPLLGFDMGLGPNNTSWFHGGRPATPVNWDLFRGSFERVTAQLRRLGVEVVNVSRATTLTCFPRLSLDEALAWLE